MTIRLEKETKITDGTSVYCIYIGNKYVTQSSSKETAQYMYEALIKSNGKEVNIEIIKEETF